MRLTLKGARANADLTQSQLAVLMGVSVATICGWEKGTTDLSAKQLRDFCRFTGISMGDVVLPDELKEIQLEKEG